jgi:hypothetical protein
MIVEFKVKNFRSIKDEQTLSFEATSSKQGEEYFCHTIKGTRLLKLGMIYGPNASGKTNILLALDFLRSIAIQEQANKTKKTGHIPFLLDESSRLRPGYFELTFFTNSTKYIYKVSLTNDEIKEESLYYYPGSQPAEVYSRSTANGIATIRFGSTIKLKDAERSILQVNTLGNMTTIAAFGTANVNFPELKEAYDYFQQKLMQTVLPNTNLTSWATDKISSSSYAKQFVIDFIHKADFNISDIAFNKRDIPEELKQVFKGIVKDQESVDDASLFKTWEINFEHTVEADGKMQKHMLPAKYQSAGTIRYYGLASVMAELLSFRKFIPIDEMESSLHPDLARHFVNMFLANTTDYQLLFTTHDINLLAIDDLRKDVVWFTEKKEDGSTDLFSLAEFNIRNETSFANAYSIGKFGAKPNLGSIFVVQNESSNGKTN